MPEIVWIGEVSDGGEDGGRFEGQGARPIRELLVNPEVMVV